MGDSYPRLSARTQRFTLGEPRNIVVSPDGKRVVFVRSRAGDDPVNCLWVLDAATGEERLVADPVALLGGDDEADLPADERARRERAREGAGGIVAFGTDAEVLAAAFALGGRLFVAGLVSAMARELPVEGPVVDPRPDPTARRVAYVSGRALRVAELDGRSRQLAGPTPEDDDPDVSWGSAEFVAAEEMGRNRGYWWAPDGESVAVARVDTSPVQRWWVANPADPATAPTELAYPVAGSDNALVTLHVVGHDGVRRRRSAGTASASRTSSTCAGPPSDRCSSPSSRAISGALQVLAADPATGTTEVLHQEDDDRWVELVPGSPSLLGDGRLVTCGDRDGTRRLLVAGSPVTPPSLQVRAIVDAAADRVVFLANEVDEPTERHVWRWSESGGCERLTSATRRPPRRRRRWHGGDTVGIARSVGAVTQVLDGPVSPPWPMTPPITPNLTLLRAGDRRIATAVLLPHGASPDDRLPVLLDPYGGPHVQRVVASADAFVASQWFAEQGFAVVVADGRGTPGRGSEWERAVYRDLAGPVLDDQIEALHARGDRAPPARPGAGGDPGLELRRLPRGAGRPAPSRRLPCRHRRRARHRVAPLRHALHRALPRRPRPRSGALRPHVAAAATPTGSSGPCCSCTGWPTTTWSPRTRCSCRRRCWPRAGPTRCCRCRASPT